MTNRICCWLLCGSVLFSIGATFETENFRVTASSAKVAQSVAKTAEAARVKIAEQWFQRALPRWEDRCQLTVTIREGKSQGLTSYAFRSRRGVDWEIQASGPLADILESIIPHEVSHTVLATQFPRPLPRWADEGAAMLVESEAEQKRLRLTAVELVKSPRRMSLRKMLPLMEYPRDAYAVKAIYTLGYSLSDFLVRNEGRQKYLDLLVRAEQVGWDRSVREVYGFESIESLERDWTSWVEAGSPPTAARRTQWVDTQPDRSAASSRRRESAHRPDQVPQLSAE